PFEQFFDSARQERRWMPPVDVKEDEKNYILTADLPGVDAKDIEITMEKGTLTIKGERRSEKVENEKGVHRVERSYGTFVRQFGFPNTVDADGISARTNNGVLTVTVPKRESEQPKKISVS
ncbi:MAG: Hsp20/alpha crystallin family protein, partial [Bdellovibrionales bacterium]|nr:Hsp20/alpha crystallin family protein [Bdellovibrionales bacterium]